MGQATVRCPKCGHDGIVITELLNSDLALISDSQTAEIGRLRSVVNDRNEAVHHLQNAMESLTKQRDAWNKACAVLYGECREGHSRGRPMDIIPKRAWAMIVELIAAAEQGNSNA